jgi:hypothetical protein
MTEYVIGPGIEEAIVANGDEARSDEQYLILLPGAKISQVFARDAIYYWYESENAVKRCPF